MDDIINKALSDKVDKCYHIEFTSGINLSPSHSLYYGYVKIGEYYFFVERPGISSVDFTKEVRNVCPVHKEEFIKELSQTSYGTIYRNKEDEVDLFKDFFNGGNYYRTENNCRDAVMPYIRKIKLKRLKNER